MKTSQKYNKENLTHEWIWKPKKINEKWILQVLNLDDYKGNSFKRNRQLEMLVSSNCKKLNSWKHDQEKVNLKKCKLHKLYV